MKVRVFVPTRGQIHYRVVERLWEYTAGTGEPPTFVWGSLGVSEARNEIVRQFLADKTAEVLVMVDDDVLPQHDLESLARLVYGPKKEWDVVGGTVLMMKPGTIFFPSVFSVNEKTGSVQPIPEVFHQTGQVECDAVGAACMAIHREVLEDAKLKHPFKMPLDNDGLPVLSEDAAFCVRVRKAGYHLCASYDHMSDHLCTVHANAVMVAYIQASMEEEEMENVGEEA